MDSLLQFVINFAITYFLMNLAFQLFNLARQRKEDRLIEETIAQMHENLVTIEKIHQSGKDFWLVYSHEQDPKFLAQGYSEKEAIDNLIKLYPDRQFFQVHERVERV